MSAKYPAFRDNTTFWEGKRVGFLLNRVVVPGVVESVSLVYRDGQKAARAVILLDSPDHPDKKRTIIWPDHLDAVYPLFEPEGKP